MSKLSENFEQLMKEKNIPIHHTEIAQGHHLYRVIFALQKSRNITVEVIIQESDTDYVDAQIVYRHVHALADRAKEAEALGLINELNEMKSGYYNFFLAGDGEIFMRTLMRLGPDLNPLYQTLIAGSGIARANLKILEERLGKTAI